jgi:UDP-2,4-diacetamido-2,4,6-trideoxy-beta-L-altropyranose hydrolase
MLRAVTAGPLVDTTVLVRADASQGIGGGHVLRCLALANALSARGARVGFVCASLPDDLAARVERSGHAVWRIESPGELLDVSGDWDRAPVSSAAQLHDASQTSAVAREVRPDWVVLDHYRFDHRWAEPVRATAGRLLVVDDLANRPHDCDILVDQTLGRAAADYERWVPSGCRTLLGARYALLRPEFAAARPRALRRRRDVTGVDRLLVSLGATDIGGTTIRVLEELVAAGTTCSIDVLLGPSAPSLDAVHRLAAQVGTVKVHVGSDDVSTLLAAADLSVGAAGTSSWERCCLGLPSVTLVIADNQRTVAARLGEAGASLGVDAPEDVAAGVLSLLADAPRRARMTAAAAAVTSGQGAALVADEMLRDAAASQGAPARWTLRGAGPGDSELIWLWRNDPVMRAMAKTSEPIAWTDHAAWFDRMLSAAASSLYLIEVECGPAAMVRFDALDGKAAVSINVNPDMRGRGIGLRSLLLACERYAAEAAPSAVVAEVRVENEPSLRLFRAAGFVEHSTDAGFVRWVRPATTSGPRPGGRP